MLFILNGNFNMASLIGISETKELSVVLTEKTGYPFADFSTSFLKRRLNYYFEKFHIRKTEHFISQLDNHTFTESLLYHLSVDVTEMFRDPGFWRSLKINVLPELIRKNSTIWIPDVSSGEELYSLLIAIESLRPGHLHPIHCNHPSQSKLEEIRLGLIHSRDMELNDSNFKRFEPDGSLLKFYSSQNNYYVVNDELMNQVDLCRGWFKNPIPKNQTGFILYRNSMLNFSKNLQEQIIAHYYDILSPGGYLAIGIKESIPNGWAEKFEIIDNQERIFRKPGLLMESK
jgi:chemotaxis protein methyltransferase CheR